MKKLIAIILTLALIFAATAPAYADNAPSHPGLRYLVEKIQQNAGYTEQDGNLYALWRWKPALPSSDGKEVWLSFSYIDGNPENGTLSVLIRTESAVFYLWYLCNDWTTTQVDCTDDTTLPDTFLMRTAESHGWQDAQTRGAETHWISGSFRTNSYTEGTAPLIGLDSNLENVKQTQLYADFVEMIVWMVDALQYEAAPDYTLHDLYFYSAWNICRFHEWDDGTIYDPPTVSHAGHVKYQCMRCGKARVELVPKLQFSDVPEDAWYNAAVDWATENGVVAGTSGDTFSPTKQCTRAEIVTMLWRAAGGPEPGVEAPFMDYPENAWYAAAVAWAWENGITKGTGVQEFSPNEPCTRAQIVTMLWRAAGSPAAETENRFIDVKPWYAEAVKWAAENGITAGKRSDLFSGSDACTRAEAVTMLWRADSNE